MSLRKRPLSVAGKNAVEVHCANCLFSCRESSATKGVLHKGVERVEEKKDDEDVAVIAFLARPLVLSVLVFVVSLAIYANTLGHDFVYDDFVAVKASPTVAVLSRCDPYTIAVEPGGQRRRLVDGVPEERLLGLVGVGRSWCNSRLHDYCRHPRVTTHLSSKLPPAYLLVAALPGILLA